MWDLELYLMFLKLDLLNYGGVLEKKRLFGLTLGEINIVKRLMIVLLFICWQVCNWRNALKFPGSNYFSMRGKIINNLCPLAKQLYPWMHNLPNNWLYLVKCFTRYNLRIDCKVICWKLQDSFNCNTSGTSKGNPWLSFSPVCIRNDHGNLVYAEGNLIGISNNLIAETVAIWLSFEFCRKNNLFPLIIETDTLAAVNIIKGAWNFPW